MNSSERGCGASLRSSLRRASTVALSCALPFRVSGKNGERGDALVLHAVLFGEVGEQDGDYSDAEFCAACEESTPDVITEIRWLMSCVFE
jgi:hypothetical protein